MTTASGLCSIRSPLDHDPDSGRIALRHATPVFDALASQTAREILTVFAEEPRSISDVAETVGTSTQNAMYHVDNLHDADLLTIIDTWYSKKGREMDIYAARYGSFVLIMEPSR